MKNGVAKFVGAGVALPTLIEIFIDVYEFDAFVCRAAAPGVAQVCIEEMDSQLFRNLEGVAGIEAAGEVFHFFLDIHGAASLVIVLAVFFQSGFLFRDLFCKPHRC